MVTTMSGQKASQHVLHLVEEQLRILPITVATILHADELDNVDPKPLSSLLLKRKPHSRKTGSGGNIVAQEVQPTEAIDFQESSQHLHDHPLDKTECVRVLISNSILSLGIYMRDHDMMCMRTPEIQFLAHVVSGIANGNRFSIKEDYVPMATFDGLVIDNRLNGALVFADGKEEGFIELGDAVALLQWLSRYLRGEKKYISGGDAG